MKLYLVIRPLENEVPPYFFYTFANDEEEAIRKVSMKWGGFSGKDRAKELNEEEIKNLVIATDYYG